MICFLLRFQMKYCANQKMLSVKSILLIFWFIQLLLVEKDLLFRRTNDVDILYVCIMRLCSHKIDKKKCIQKPDLYLFMHCSSIYTYEFWQVHVVWISILLATCIDTSCVLYLQSKNICRHHNADCFMFNEMYCFLFHLLNGSVYNHRQY